MTKAIRKRLAGSEGFTLIELMVVVMIIAVLIAIAIPSFLGFRKSAQDRSAQSELRNVLLAEKAFWLEDGDYTETAGDITAQANTASLALNPQGGSTARITTQQSIYSDIGTPFQGAIARIETGAFADTAGLVSINQASGKGNAQANGILFVLGVEGEVIADSVLAQTAPQAGTPTEVETSPDSFRKASIAEGAFRNVSGVVQINQSAGSGNATANNFVLRMETKH